MLLKPSEVADRLRVSGMTVYRLIHTGELPAIQVGRSFRIEQEDVEAYLARNKVVADDQG